MRYFPLFTFLLLSLVSTSAVEYPGPDPGPATANLSPKKAVLENEVLTMHWSIDEGALKPLQLTHKANSRSLDLGDGECFTLLLGQTPYPGTRRVSASHLALEGPPELQRIDADPEAVRKGDRFGGWELSARLRSESPYFEIVWSAVLRDGANYIRQSVTLVPGDEWVEVAEVVLLEFTEPGARVEGLVAGSPVVGDTTFFGVEHPASTSEVDDEDRVRCSYLVNNAIRPGELWTMSSVIGVYPKGQRRRGFLHYLERERAQPYRPFLHHNNGEDVGKVYWNMRGGRHPGPDNEQSLAFRARQQEEWQKLIEEVGGELAIKRKVELDAFVHDYMWDDEHLVWQFHDCFPEGFQPLIPIAERYGADLGVWFSPWGGYPARRQRNEGGEAQGLERNQRGLSLAGPRYYARYRQACMNFMQDHGVTYFKFDGFAGSNSPPGPEVYRSDVEALWRLMGEIREVDPDVFINPSSGTWASPFWLLRSDSIWRGGGDAGVIGRGRTETEDKFGSERQQWITYRDFEVNERVRKNGPLYPLTSLMIHGIMINRGERVKTYDEPDMVDEIRSFFASGVNCQELYISPDRMTPGAWDALAESALWSRANRDVLADTHWIGGDPAEGEIYGWASWSQRKGILSLRNPIDRESTVTLDIADAFDLPTGAAQAFVLKSPWEEEADSKELRLEAGQAHEFRLEPFEVLILDALPES